MAGLPGTGKSTLAARLAEATGGVVLSKDVVRAALFPAPVLDYTAEQDEIAMSAVYSAAAYILALQPPRPVFIDGRTFSKPGQLDAPLAAGRGTRRAISRDRVRVRRMKSLAPARIASDHAAGTHPAGNRTPELYERAKAVAVPLTVPRLTLDTGALAFEECVRRATEYLSE